MKKILALVLGLVMIFTVFAGCAQQPADAPDSATEPTEPAEPTAAPEQDDPAVRTADPNHTEIVIGGTQSFINYLSFLPEKMGEWGYTVTFQAFDDVVTPDIALAEGSIDANFYQHKPYLDAYNEANGTNLYACEPYLIASYESIVSKKYTSLDELPDGAKIAIADDSSNMSFDLHSLQYLGLIELAEIPEGSFYTTFDITANPHNYELIPMAMMQRYTALDDVDAACMFYSARAAEMYEFNVLDIITDDPDIMFPVIIAIDGQYKDEQWVKDMMDAIADKELRAVMEELNTPNLTWNILFEDSSAGEEPVSADNTEVRTADPTNTEIIIGCTQQFANYIDFLPAKMAEWGYTVELQLFDDVVTPNIALVEGSIDANFFQHKPYMDAYNESNNTDIYACEPYLLASFESIVSKKYTSLDEIPDGATIAIADDSSNMSFDLHSLQFLGLIELAEIPEGSYYTLFDIVDNPHNFEFVAMPMMQRYSALDDVDAACLFYSGRAAEKYEFNVLRILDDDPDVLFPNIVAVNGKDKDAQWVKDMMDAIAGEELLANMAEANTPYTIWRILF